MPDRYNLIVDPEKHAINKKRFLKLLKASKIPPLGKPHILELEYLFNQLHVIKLARKEKPPQTHDVYFPTQKARAQFISWMDDPKTLLAMEASSG